MNEIDNFNFWEQHVKYVVKEAVLLAEKYNVSCYPSEKSLETMESINLYILHNRDADLFLSCL